MIAFYAHLAGAFSQPLRIQYAAAGHGQVVPSQGGGHRGAVDLLLRVVIGSSLQVAGSKRKV